MAQTNSLGSAGPRGRIGKLNVGLSGTSMRTSEIIRILLAQHSDMDVLDAETSADHPTSRCFSHHRVLV
jgi:hypothetical protein